MGFELAKISLQKTCECLAVTGLIAGHLMNRVMDGIQIQGLCSLGQISLAGGRAILSIDTHLEILLGRIGQNLTQHFCKACRMISLFEGGLLVIHANFGITLTESGTRHCKIHADL